MAFGFGSGALCGLLGRLVGRVARSLAHVSESVVRHWCDLRSEIAHGRTPEPHGSLEREVHGLDALEELRFSP